MDFNWRMAWCRRKLCHMGVGVFCTPDAGKVCACDEEYWTTLDRTFVYAFFCMSSVLLVGDSFRTAMIPAMQETFSDVCVIHRSCRTPNLLDEINPEYVIMEYVERYSQSMGEMNELFDF